MTIVFAFVPFVLLLFSCSGLAEPFLWPLGPPLLDVRTLEAEARAWVDEQLTIRDWLADNVTAGSPLHKVLMHARQSDWSSGQRARLADSPPDETISLPGTQAYHVNRRGHGLMQWGDNHPAGRWEIYNFHTAFMVFDLHHIPFCKDPMHTFLGWPTPCRKAVHTATVGLYFDCEPCQHCPYELEKERMIHLIAECSHPS